MIPRPCCLCPNAASVFGQDGELLDPAGGDQIDEAMTVLLETINTMSGAKG